MAVMAQEEMIHIALIGWACINVLTFLVFGVDKYKARHSRRRISEAALLGLVLIGGSVGAWLGMLVWHHKTKHRKFRFGIPFILLAQLAAALMM